MAKAAVPAIMPHLNTLLNIILSILLCYLYYSVSSPSSSISDLHDGYLTQRRLVRDVLVFNVFSCRELGV